MSICEQLIFFNNHVYFSDKFSVHYEKNFYFVLGADGKVLFILPQTSFRKRHSTLTVCTAAILEKN